MVSQHGFTGEGRMANGHSRVTVISPDRRIDLSLPGSVPLGDLMAQLLDLCTDHHDRTGALAWTLRPVGGTGLAWESSLESARVRDGAVLELCPRSTAAAQCTVEDVRDATEDAVDRTVGTWSRRDTTTIAVLTLAVLGAIVAALPNLWATSSVNGVPVAIATTGVLLWGCVSVARHDLTVAAHALLAAGLIWTGAVVLAATTPAALAAATLTPAIRGALTGAAILGVTAVVAWAVPRLTAWSAAAAVAFGATLVWAAMDLAGRSIDEAIAVGTVLGVLSLGVLPRASLAAGGLAGLDYLVRTRGGVNPDTVVATFVRSRALLTGALFATAGLTAAGSFRLEFAGSSLQVAQAAAIAGCLVLRARAFSQFLHVLTLVLAGTTALVVQLTADLLHAAPRLTTIAALGLVLTWTALLARGGMSTRNDVTGARSRRLLDIAESLTVATLIPLLAGNLGVLDWVRELVN